MTTAVEDNLAAAASVDTREIAKFNKLAATWWDASGPMWPLHTLNQLRSGYIVEQVARHFQTRDTDRPLAGLRVLDIGCGGGLLSEAMARNGAQVHGVDISDGNIAVARQHAAEHAVGMEQIPQYELCTAESLHQRGEQYDVVLNMEVVEHVADLPAFMQACSGMVRTGGLHFIATINRNFLSWLSAIIAVEYVLKWLSKGTHQYHRLVKPSQLHTLLSRDGLRPVASSGVFVNPLNRKMSLSRLQLINYMLVAEKADAG